MSKKSKNLIPADVADKLDRMRIINSAWRADDELFLSNDELREEYYELQEEMVEMYFPLVVRLAKAGLFCTDVEFDGMPNGHDWPVKLLSSISGYAIDATKDCNILLTCNLSGYLPKKKDREHGRQQ